MPGVAGTEPPLGPLDRARNGAAQFGMNVAIMLANQNLSVEAA